MLTIRLLLFAIFTNLLLGCTIYKSPEKAIPLEHVVMFDSNGNPLNPSGNIGKPADLHDLSRRADNKHTDLCLYQNESTGDYLKHIEIIKNGINKKFPSSKKKILIFIHGGLNTQVDSVMRLVEPFEKGGKSRTELIKEAGYYPIFINWKSSLISSYGEHLFSLRQGENYEKLAIVTSPFVLATDIGRSILRWPLVLSSSIMNDRDTVPGLDDNKIHEVAKEALCLRFNAKTDSDITQCVSDIRFREPISYSLYDRHSIWRGDFNGVSAHRPYLSPVKNRETFPVMIGENEYKNPEMFWKFSQWLLTIPTKIISTPIIDTFGSSSWDVMLRRTDLLFDKEKAPISLLKNNPLNDGGLSIFLKKLREEIVNKKDNWEITLIGHSMGTIVANKIIRDFGEDLPIKKIVYLGAADSVEHYEETVFPYLTESENKDAEMYHFVLHPTSEEGEKNPDWPILDLAPRGSLLVWIDNFLAKPLSLQQRTIGRYDNLMRSLHDTPDDIRGRIHLRVFSAGGESANNNPLTHSEIANIFKFWDDDCLNAKSEEASANSNCIVPVAKRID